LEIRLSQLDQQHGVVVSLVASSVSPSQRQDKTHNSAQTEVNAEEYFNRDHLCVLLWQTDTVIQNDTP
jgi:hypothetical protein